MKPQPNIPAGHSQGFTLMEIMVAMLIFAVGMLGLASLQTLALQTEHASYTRNQAILLTYEMADRMKANPAPGVANNYVIAHGEDAPVAQDCSAASCTTAEMVNYDLAAWKTALSTLLLAGDGEITGNFPDYSVTVRWDEERRGATGTGCDGNDPDDLTCFTLQVTL